MGERANGMTKNGIPTDHPRPTLNPEWNHRKSNLFRLEFLLTLHSYCGHLFVQRTLGLLPSSTPLDLSCFEASLHPAGEASRDGRPQLVQEISVQQVAAEAPLAVFGRTVAAVSNVAF